ncbi:MAG TPA: DDE-type integrase/transposase/recombinase [Vicinamibacteria bacterium]|nr:DDE-type integrase/transposase/recombinase [Vicinamibacteria bacterium]
MQAHSAAQEHAVLARLLSDVAEILGSRWDKVPDKRRPHYSPHQRWRILEIKRVLAYSAEETAALFRVATATINRWEIEAGREPGRETIGSLLRPVPPLRRYADVVRSLVQRMDRLGFPSTGKIAATLARAGWRLARETVRRYRHEPPAGPRSPSARSRQTGAPIEARAPHHVWLADLTHVRGLFGLATFRIAAVFDAFSRMPLALRVFTSEPSAADVAQLFAGAVRRHGRPALLVTDHGPQFTAVSFEAHLRQLRVEHRIGAVGLSGSIALLERYWRTLKESLQLPVFAPLTLRDLERRVAYSVLHYGYYRPHQALEDATPAEVLFGWPQAGDKAISPPRAAQGTGSHTAPFKVAFLDADARHPILVKAA